LDAIERCRKYIFRIGAISVCLINNDSDLDINYKNYRLVLPVELSLRAKEWFIADGKNDYTIRKDRAEKVIALVNRLGLTYVTATT